MTKFKRAAYALACVPVVLVALAIGGGSAHATGPHDHDWHPPVTQCPPGQHPIGVSGYGCICAPDTTTTTRMPTTTTTGDHSVITGPPVPVPPAQASSTSTVRPAQPAAVVTTTASFTG